MKATTTLIATFAVLCLVLMVPIPHFHEALAQAESAVGSLENSPGQAHLTPTEKPSPDEKDPKKKAFAFANPEDITNENFPDLIESFDYPNAEISDVIKAISELTGKNFIVDPQVRGKITIIAPTQVSVAEAYKAFLSALAINGYTVVPSGKFLKIKAARNAQRDSIETYSGNYFPNSDQLITRIIKLKYINAADVNKELRILPSKDGEMVPYAPTNSIIISDYGSNIERVMNIINQLDVPGFEEQLTVIRIRYAKAKDVADLLDQIINKGEKRGSNRFSSGVPQFRRSSGSETGGGSGAESYSLVVNDDRTNSIIVVGNKAGIAKIHQLIAKLDFKLRPEDQGGVFVYYVRHSEAEQIEKVLNGIAAEAKKASGAGGGGGAPNNPTGVANPLSQGARVFGGEVQVAADKNTNSLIVTASKQDYEIVKNILSKIDIARDQVFVKAIIMEMNSTNGQNWGVDYYAFDRSSNGIGRMGFRSNESIASLIDPAGDLGGILGFGSGQTFELKAGGTTATVSSLVGLVKFIKSSAGGNILSTPQIMALDNEEATIEVGEKIPVNLSQNQAAVGGAISTTANREDVTIKLIITPFISPDTESVKMKIEQHVAQLSQTQIQGDLGKAAVATTKRLIKTQIVVNSGDTAVLGGLMSDAETEKITKIPILGDIPILGWLFKGKNSQKNKSNLVVFITPQIVRDSQDNAEILNFKIDERIDFIKNSMGGRDPHGEIIDKLPRRASNSRSSSSPKRSSGALKPLPAESSDEISVTPEPEPGEVPEPLEEPAVESF
ncbi:MAG: type II secretion system secretin GspD [Bdellovibrionales bacterium]|nr:type II secretion system secretin GspD [Bdellovibrionales bacterium]